MYIYEKFGLGFASRGWGVDVVNCLEKEQANRYLFNSTAN